MPSPVAGAVWKLLAAEGEGVAAGQPLLVLEAMKAEITVAAPRCREGAVVAMGQRLPRRLHFGKHAVEIRWVDAVEYLLRPRALAGREA